MTQHASKTQFQPVEPKTDFIAMEERLLKWWYESGITGKYLRRNEDAEKTFSFIDGPITANNPMGVHHAWGRTYKDLFLRFRNMQGYRQRFQNGFDGQGLWVEVEVEKEKGFTSKRDIESYGVGRFVEDCKARVRRYAGVQTEQSKRLGYFMDWDNSYHTMSDENNYTIWRFLKVCHERGWLYEGTDSMPWCPRCGTGLSQHEIVTEGYKEVTHPGLYVKLPLTDRPGESLLIWTTTPWTLSANVAAAVHPEHKYAKVRNGEETLWLGASRLSVLDGGHEVLEQAAGGSLVGWRYRGPFDELDAQSVARDAHRVVPWDDVGEEEGTGIVHVAPGAGAEDFQLGKEHGLPVIAPLDESGRYIDGFGELSGRAVSDVNPDIFDSLKAKGVFYKLEDYRHRYPVCWRCDTELVFRLVDEWFISMDELRHPMMEATNRIRWEPSFGRERELDWLRNMHDWMISKKRYWGLALPIYKCGTCPNVEVIGSETELERRAVEGWERFEGHSPHRPWIDAVKIACSGCGERISRIPDVGNPWLDAGIVTFSTLNYRSDPEYWKQWYPADWISESFPGQFRNWFYSLIAMSAALMDREPTRAVFSYALVRDEDGEEMHKSKGNAIWFEDAAEKMGVDVMRWLYCRQNPSSNLSFGYGPGDIVRRQFLIPLWNVYSFFVTYANLDGWTPAQRDEPHELNELDRWILSELNRLTQRLTGYLENWRPDYAAHAVEEFLTGLSNWYVRRSRRRFWKSGGDADKRAAYRTLYDSLTTLSRLLAPFTPFVAEEMYRNLAAGWNGQSPESVHLEDWPACDESLIDDELAERTRLAMRLASLGRSARASAGLKVRQPLSELAVELRKEHEKGYLPKIEWQLKEELNVKRVVDAGEIGGLTAWSVRPNLPVLGPKYGRDLPQIRAALAGADAARVASLVEAGENVPLDGFLLEPGELLVERTPQQGYELAAAAGYAAAVKTELTESLRQEGMAREVVRLVQNLRKSTGLDISDRIELGVQGPHEVESAVRRFASYVERETLAVELIHTAQPAPQGTATHNLDGHNVTVTLARARASSAP